MKNILVTILIIASSLASYNARAQEISLEECRQKAVLESPLSQQFELLKKNKELKTENIGKNYLPKLDLNAQASYQSDVTRVPLELPPQFDVSIPAPDKDQYRIALDVSQVIYDGGTTGYQKDLEEIDYSIQREELELELYQLKQRVNHVYFGIMMLRKQAEVLNLLKETLQSKMKDLQAAEKFGAVLGKDVKMLKSELIQVEQEITSNQINLKAQIGVLSDLTGEDYSPETRFMLPEPQKNYGFSNNRPEYKLLSLNQNKLNESKSLTGTKKIPRLYGFGQAGYGKPGLNMLANEFDTYYLLGAKISWKFWDWSHTKKEKEILSIQEDILETKKKSFEKNLRIDLQQKLSEIRKYEKLIETDREIIELKSEISLVSSAQLDNGVITSAEYIEDINAESKAKLNLEIHKIQLIKARVDYLAATGDL